MESFDNIKIEGEAAYLSIDLSSYPLKVIYSTSYVFLDKTYIQLLSKENNIVLVRLKLKNEIKGDVEKIANEFLNELIVFADYDKNQEETLKVREAILQRVLLTNDPESFEKESEELLDEEFEEFLKELDKEEENINNNSSKVIAPWEKETE